MYDSPHYKPWCAFQAYPVCRTTMLTSPISEVPRPRRWMSRKNWKCPSNRSYPKSCFKAENSNREQQEQENRHEDERDSTFLPSSDFAFILTLIVTAAAGGPVLVVWGVFFLLLGKYTEAPSWLQVFSTFLFAGITDTLSYNWASTSLDSGYTPFFVFVLGSGAAALYEFTSFLPGNELHSFPGERAVTPESKSVKGGSHDTVDRGITRNNDELTDWDQAFRETQSHRSNDENS